MINLSSKWRVNADGNCYTLEELVVNKKTGESDWISKYYYSTVPGALIGYRKHALRSSLTNDNVLTLQETVNLIKKFDEDFKINIKNICNECKLMEVKR